MPHGKVLQLQLLRYHLRSILDFDNRDLLLNTSLFSVDMHGNDIIYLAYLLQLYDLSRFTEGTGVPTLNRNKFHDKPIIDVPLNEQEQFAVFVKQTDKSKLEIQQSLDKLELLKKSLMQEYFG